METVTTIEGFKSLLATADEENPLARTLRAICAIEQPEEIRRYKQVALDKGPVPQPQGSWGGWAW